MNNVFDDCKLAVVIVAHPDDETLWCGGIMLANPKINWTILTLCRKSDPDRSPKFFKAAAKYNATGIIADLDDGPEQSPLAGAEIQRTILDNLPKRNFDLILTHSPKGEYTRHLRHEEVSDAVFSLWKNGELKAKNLLMFAYEDGGRKYSPRPVKNADIAIPLAKNVLKTKREIIIKLYGFLPGSFEAKAVGDVESFWRIQKPEDIGKI
jgi:LmbE family N-acetylglucosaminyl deacetylase